MQIYFLKEFKSLSNMIARRMHDISRSRSFEGITGITSWIIGFLTISEGKNIYQKDIEREFCLTRSAVSQALTQMESKGLILRTGAEHDCRLKRITLTPKARAISQDMCRMSHEVETVITQGFSQEELETLSSFISRMKANLDDSFSLEQTTSGKE